jgi:subtilisin family serine protease
MSNPKLRLENLEVWKENRLPVIDVRIESLKTIQLLRKSNLLRYVEPMGYDPLTYEQSQINDGLFAGSGCGAYAGDTTLVSGLDYSVIAPNAKMSWNYAYHGIRKAWTKSTGKGVKIMVIDTGVDPDQDNLGNAFNQGYSSGRTLDKIFTLPNATSADDDCGHGTTMCGEAAAPRCTDGNACGVAYNCNLVICRASKDVYLNESDEVKGVSDAYTHAGDDASVRIISMSMGRVTSNSQIKDAINYAYGKGKLMFCAGGTSFAWAAGFVGVIFPANLGNVEAITGVKDSSALKACSDCHKGKQIDFVIVMEKSLTKVNPLSTATSGDIPTTVGGSSVATSTAAGIAALVWSRFPNYTRTDVVNKLTVTASAYPNKTADYGWGKLNADKATN